MDHFEKNNYITKIESRKKLFREPKKANEVDTVLADYSQCIRMSKNNSGTAGKNGAFLLCVIGKIYDQVCWIDVGSISKQRYQNDIDLINQGYIKLMKFRITAQLLLCILIRN